MLLELRDDVDDRAAALLESHEDEPAGLMVPVPATRPHRRRHYRWAVIPAAGALVLASTGVAAALSGSPTAPLYPLHRLIFGNATPNDAATITADLDAAQKLLNRAAGQRYADRADALSQARTLLVDARRRLPMAGTQGPTLSMRLSAELALLKRLETPPVAGGTQPSQAPPSGGASVSPEPDSSEGTAGDVEGSNAEGGSDQEGVTATAARTGGDTEGTEPGSAPAANHSPDSETSESPAPTPVATRSGWRGSDDSTGQRVASAAAASFVRRRRLTGWSWLSTRAATGPDRRAGIRPPHSPRASTSRRPSGGPARCTACRSWT